MSLNLLRRRRNDLLLAAAAAAAAAAGVSVYVANKLYSKRNEIKNLFKTLTLISDLISSSFETINLLSTDLNRFLQSNSDEIPSSFKQISKVVKSDEVSRSISKVSEALTIGMVNGVGFGSQSESESRFSDKILDKVFSESGSGFVSVVVGSFARNLVLGFYSTGNGDESSSSSNWIHLICDKKCQVLIADCIRIFVSNAVSVYLDKTMEVNAYDEFFSGLTNPKHEVKVKDFLVSVCNSAVETFIKTSHQVMTNSNQVGSSDERITEIGKWVDQVSSTLAVPRNRRLVLDVTGRVTFETVKSFLEFVMWKVYDCAKRGGNVVREEAFDRGFEVVRYVGARSMIVATICFALCMHVTVRMRGLDANLTQHSVLLQ